MTPAFRGYRGAADGSKMAEVERLPWLLSAPGWVARRSRALAEGSDA